MVGKRKANNAAPPIAATAPSATAGAADLGKLNDRDSFPAKTPTLNFAKSAKFRMGHPRPLVGIVYS